MTPCPEKYQRALFVLDWTFGTIYAVHLTPHGSTYLGEMEEFIVGVPLAVTDAVLGTDGEMYFAVGGRRTDSSLYRVSYVGAKDTDLVDAKNSKDADLRARRHQLEAMHGNAEGDLELIFAHLDHSDRFIRYAARVALGWQPVECWRVRALTTSRPRVAISVLMALSRQGRPQDLEPVLTALDDIDWKSLDELGRLALLRTYSLASIRLGKPSDPWREQVVNSFALLFPSESARVNAELVQLLVYLNSSDVIEKTLAVMEALPPELAPDWDRLTERSSNYGSTVAKMLRNMPPTHKIHFAFVLRNLKEEWTISQRKRYFQFFLDAVSHPGAESYAGFLKNIREDAIATCSQTELVALESLISRSLNAEPVETTPPTRPGRKWPQTEALQFVGGELTGRDYSSGRNLFHATQCAKCHRLASEGGTIGPDLSTSGKKFSREDFLDAILEPSKAISNQYGSHEVVTTDGKVLLERVVSIEGKLHV